MISKRWKGFAAESFWIGLGQFFAAAGSLVGVKLLTEVMRPESYGVFSLAIITTTLLHSVLWSPLASAAQRYFSHYSEIGQRLFFLHRLLLFSYKLSAATLALMVVSLVWAAFFYDGFAGFAVLVFLTLFFSICYGASYTIDSIQNAARNRKLVSFHSGVFSWLRFVLAFVCVLLMGDSSSAAMAGFAVASVLLICSEWFFFKRKILSFCDVKIKGEALTEIDKRIIKYSWPFIVIGLCSWLQLSSDRWFLQIFNSSAEVGYYSSIFQIGYSPIVVIFIFLFQAISPLVFIRAGGGDDDARVKSADSLNFRFAGILALIVMIAFLASLGLSDYVKYFLGESYHGVVNFFPLMVLSGGLFSIAQCLMGYFMVRGETESLVKPMLLFTFSGTLIVFIMTFFGGLTGAFYARLVSSLLFLLFIVLLIRRGSERRQSAPE